MSTRARALDTSFFKYNWLTGSKLLYTMSARARELDTSFSLNIYYYNQNCNKMEMVIFLAFYSQFI